MTDQVKPLTAAADNIAMLHEIHNREIAQWKSRYDEYKEFCEDLFEKYIYFKVQVRELQEKLIIATKTDGN